MYRRRHLGTSLCMVGRLFVPSYFTFSARYMLGHKHFHKNGPTLSVLNSVDSARYKNIRNYAEIKEQNEQRNKIDLFLLDLEKYLTFRKRVVLLLQEKFKS